MTTEQMKQAIREDLVKIGISVVILYFFLKKSPRRG